MSEIERTSSTYELKNARIQALDSLLAPCLPLGDLATIRRELAILNSETMGAGDALEKAQREAMLLASASLPRDTRQRRLEELMALDDAEAVTAVLGVFLAPGATFEGSPLPAQEFAAFRLAWDMALCTNYGACRDHNSFEAHLDCLLHSNCQYQNVWQAVGASLFFGSVARRAEEYFVRIQDRLSRRDFSAFGVP